MPKRLFAGLLISGVTLFSGLLAGLAYYEYEQLPLQTVRALKAPQWKAWNLQSYAVQRPDSFLKVESLLTARIQQPQYKNNPTPYYLRAQWRQAFGHLDKARSDYQRVLRMAGRNWYTQKAYQLIREDAYEQLAIISYKSNDYKGALRYFALLDLNPEYSTASPLAVALYNRLEDPERGDFHFILAKELMQRLELDLAQNELTLAIRHTHSPQLLMEIHNYRQTQMPKNGQSVSPLLRYYALGSLHHQYDEENPTLAIAFLKRGLQLAPTFEWLHNELALAYRAKRQYYAAEMHAKLASVLNPDLYHAQLTLGDLAVDQEKYTTAIQYFQKAQAIISRLPDSENDYLRANLYNQIGYAWECLNRLEPARRYYRLAMASASTLDDMQSSDEYAYAQESLERLNQRLPRQKSTISQVQGDVFQKI